MNIKEQIVKEILEYGDVQFIDIVKFNNAGDYNNASDNHTDKLCIGEDVMDIDELLAIEENIVEYSITELDREMYARSVLANSSVSIDDIWSEDEVDKSLIVKILVD